MLAGAFAISIGLLAWDRRQGIKTGKARPYRETPAGNRLLLVIIVGFEVAFVVMAVDSLLTREWGLAIAVSALCVVGGLCVYFESIKGKAL